MKRNIILFAIALMPMFSKAQTAADVGNAAKAAAVSEAMADSVGRPASNTPEPEKPVKRRSTVVFTSAIIVVIVAVAAARRRKKNGMK